LVWQSLCLAISMNVLRGPFGNSWGLFLWKLKGDFTMNGKTSLVHYRTLWFFAFSYFLNEIWFLATTTFVSLRYIQSLILTTFASLRFLSSILKTCLLHFANLIFGNNYVRFASLDSQFYINLLRFASISKFFHINMFASLRNKFSNYRTCSLRLDF
jgi:hypothetical protein